MYVKTVSDVSNSEQIILPSSDKNFRVRVINFPHTPLAAGGALDCILEGVFSFYPS